MRTAAIRVRVVRAAIAVTASLVVTVGGAQALEPDAARARAAYLEAERARVTTYTVALDALPAAMAADLPANLTPFLRWRPDRARRFARFDAGVPDGREVVTAAYWRDLSASTATWTEWLQAVVTTYGRGAPPLPDPATDGTSAWAGRWVDGYGGAVSAVPLERGRLALRLEVVRGGHRHVGLLVGAADLDDGGTRATLTRSTEVGGERVTTTLVATLLDGGLNVTVENGWPWRGVEAYFDGRYLRVGPLDGDARQRLLREVGDPRP
ncbi:MAG: hypothetical protein RI554_10660 [Trueperaceae bacterium]|nr:hypothetical protein [Trueperaceae bacterium]